MSSLDSIIDDSLPININGENLVISTIKMRDIKPFLENINPILIDLKAENVDCLTIVTNHYSNIVNVVSIAARKDVEWVESLDLNDVVKLIMAIIETNSDFFVNQILPAFVQGLQGLEKKIKLNGLKLTLPSDKQG